LASSGATALKVTVAFGSTRDSKLGVASLSVFVLLEAPVPIPRCANERQSSVWFAPLKRI
jgi:hypothetical protein